MRCRRASSRSCAARRGAVSGARTSGIRSAIVTPAIFLRRVSSSSATSLANTGDGRAVRDLDVARTKSGQHVVQADGRRRPARHVAVHVAAHLGDQAARLQPRDDAFDVVRRQAEIGDQLLLRVAGAAGLVRRRHRRQQLRRQQAVDRLVVALAAILRLQQAQVLQRVRDLRPQQHQQPRRVDPDQQQRASGPAGRTPCCSSAS